MTDSLGRPELVRGGLLFSDGLQLPAAFPHAGQRLPKFLIRDVQVPLRRLDVRVTEHQLDDADVDAVRQEAAGALVPQIVPVQVELPQLLAVDPSSRPGAFCLVPVRDQEERFPGGLEAVLEVTRFLRGLGRRQRTLGRVSLSAQRHLLSPSEDL